VAERDFGFHSLTRAVRHGAIPWSVQGFLQARTVVRKARSGEIRLSAGVAGLSADLLDRADLDQVALGLWLRRQHESDDPEILAAHHLRFHAVEDFLERHADLLVEEGLLKEAEGILEPDALLLSELVARPYDVPLTSRHPPSFHAGEVLKAVARRARQGSE
jgi:hypothetical protein